MRLIGQAVTFRKGAKKSGTDVTEQLEERQRIVVLASLYT